MGSDGFGRRLLVALADASPAFRAKPESPIGGFGRRLLVALADASPAFRPFLDENELRKGSGEAAWGRPYLHIPKVDRWRAVPFDMPPDPERGTVLQRVRQITESLEGAIDEGTGPVLDRIIEAWVAKWIATIEADYTDHCAVINVHRGQARQWLADAAVVTEYETEELERIRAADVRLGKRYRQQTRKVAEAQAIMARARVAVDHYDAELDREDKRRQAAIADRQTLGVEAANYARILMMAKMQDPAKTGLTETGLTPELPAPPEDQEPPEHREA